MTSEQTGPRQDSPLALGIDFGTLSGRVLVLELATGAGLAVSEVPYSHGVIEDRLPGTEQRLAADWALQHPGDYMQVIEEGIPAALRAAAVDPARVIGVGVDFTSCTVLPTGDDGTPLCLIDRWRAHPHAWPKLWKHHAAQPEADLLTALASERSEPFLARCGGRISSEWYFPKLLQIYREDRPVYDASAKFMEATDWIVMQLTGVEHRCSCAASYKAFWHPVEGAPSAAYLDAAAPGFGSARERLGDTFSPLGTKAGTIRSDLAARIGLRADVAVAVGNVDSFVSVPGAGVATPGTFVTVVGTSICDMVVDPEEILVSGTTGVVRDGIIPGLYGYESGQPAVGDMLGWFVAMLHRGAGEDRGAAHAELEGLAAELAPGSTGLLALNWWNGNRSILADADLSGVILGLTLSSTAAEIYRALLESIAFAARRIIDNYTEHGLGIDRIVACGGIAEKSPTLIQIFADATGRPVDVPGSPQIPARGAAMFGAVAAGPQAGGFENITDAAAVLAPQTARSFLPDPAASAVYERVYAIYRDLHDVFGRDRVDWLHGLKGLRPGTAGVSVNGPATI